MGSRLSAPGPQEKRFAAYIEGLANAAGHEDRHAPLKNYCKGLLLPGERKSIEPMAARLDPGNVQPMRQSLHHLVAKAPWSDETLLGEVRNQVLPAMQKQGPVVAWIVDDTGFPKKGKHSVGVARQYCGQVGKQDNCRVAVSLSVATWSSSLPIAYRLYLPKEWAEDAERREKTEVPEEVRFQTKPEIALDQIRAAVAAKVDRESCWPTRLTASTPSFATDSPNWTAICRGRAKHDDGLGTGPTAPASQATRKNGTPSAPVAADNQHQPVSVKQLAMSLPSTAFKEVTWREAGERKLRSRFAAVRVRAAHRDYEKAEPHAEEWLLIEWPRGEAEPTKYWVSTLPPTTKLKALIKMAKHRWIIERDYEELKQELGLGHFEGRNWRGFHHHATLCIAAYGFLVAERTRFSPSARAGHLGFVASGPAADFHPRGSPGPSRAA